MMGDQTTPDDAGDLPPGAAIVNASLAGTALFTVAAVVAAAAPGAAAGPVAVLDVVLGAVGVLSCLAAYGIGVQRSRVDAVTIAGLFFLSGTAPAGVRRRLLGALGVQVVVGVATSAVRVYTPLAFGILVPLFGLGLTALWGARHGTFFAREPDLR
jgi:hypothetical protein